MRQQKTARRQNYTPLEFYITLQKAIFTMRILKETYRQDLNPMPFLDVELLGEWSSFDY
jgi:hypothetical protein